MGEDYDGGDPEIERRNAQYAYLLGKSESRRSMKMSMGKLVEGGATFELFKYDDKGSSIKYFTVPAEVKQNLKFRKGL